MAYLIKDLDEAAIEAIAAEMRAADRMEFDLMSGGKSIPETLNYMKGRSRVAKAAYVDGELVCVFGIIAPAILSTVGSPWFAATDRINQPDVRRLFLRRSRYELAKLSEGFDKMWNVVEEGNRVAIRWLKWLGFVFPGMAYDIKGRNFLYFKMESDDVH